MQLHVDSDEMDAAPGATIAIAERKMIAVLDIITVSCVSTCCALSSPCPCEAAKCAGSRAAGDATSSGMAGPDVGEAAADARPPALVRLANGHGAAGGCSSRQFNRIWP
jgi:hypothetical protein